MQIPEQFLKPLDSAGLSTDERKMLACLRAATWEAQPEGKEPTFRAKIPEFFGGVRLYRVAAGGPVGNPVEMLIKKLAFQGSISKQGLYPLAVQGVARYLVLSQAEMDNLGIGQDDDED